MTASAPKFIRLEGRVFNSWKRYKEKFGFKEKTDSEFAARLLQISLEGNEVNRGGGQMINCQSSDGFQGEKSLPSNIEKETSRKSKQVERWDKQTVMQKIDATKQKMTTLAQLSIEEAVLASIVLICGNNYLKIKSLCEAVNLEVTHDSFLNFQRSCIAPVFEEVWSGMNDLVEKLLRNQEEICLCTAGTRNSINGCIARLENGCSSAATVKDGLWILLKTLAEAFPFNRLISHEAPIVIKLVRDIKVKFPHLMNVFHDFDVSSKASDLTRTLHQAATIEGCSGSREWIPFIVKQFKGDQGETTRQMLDASTLQEMLDSVCEENIPARGLSLPNKAHKDTEDLISLRTSSKNSRALVVLRKVILDPSWITTFNVYFRFRSLGDNWERSLKSELQNFLERISREGRVSDQESAKVLQCIAACETRDSWCQVFDDIVVDRRDYVYSMARAFTFLRHEIEKYLEEVKEEQKGDRIIDLTFLAHGEVQSPMLPCSIHYLSDRVDSVTLYQPWGCALHASAAYGIATGNISPEMISYTDIVLPAKPSDWNTLPKDYTCIPEVVFNRVRTTESVYQMLIHLFNVLKGKTRGLVIPYFQPQNATDLPEIPLWALSNAVALLGCILHKRFRIHIAACLLPNTKTTLTKEIYKYPWKTVNCRQYCVVPIHDVSVSMKIPEFDVPENLQQAFAMLNTLLGSPDSEICLDEQ